MTSSQLHVAVSGWLLGQPSGANRRLLAVVEHAAALLEPGERITVLYGRAAGHRPPADSEGVRWHAVPIAASPTLRRVFGERRHLAATLAAIGANVLDHGFLPLPRTGVKTCLLLHDLR
ncbi:MAG: hypothetical protein KDE27_15180, partial [Planctomycetes bacterium]|nr:hypothetical protein [Planctomycetota bacterium]